MNLFLGQVDEAKRLIVESTQKRLQKQVAKDGSQPYELERTNSWSYATMNLQGFILMAKMGEKIGVDLWHYTNEGQMYLKSMIDWFVPFLKKKKSGRGSKLAMRRSKQWRMSCGRQRLCMAIGLIQSWPTI